MARHIKTVTIRAVISFDDIRVGDEGSVPLTPRVQGWINAGFVEVLSDGPNPPRSRRPEPDDHERVTEGAEGSVPAGGESGEGARSGGHGSSESVDQG